jgi:hypothetical protein
MAPCRRGRWLISQITVGRLYALAYYRATTSLRGIEVANRKKAENSSKRCLTAAKVEAEMSAMAAMSDQRIRISSG